MFFSFCITKHNYGSGIELSLLVRGFRKSLTLLLVLNCYNYFIAFSADSVKNLCKQELQKLS